MLEAGNTIKRRHNTKNDPIVTYNAFTIPVRSELSSESAYFGSSTVTSNFGKTEKHHDVVETSIFTMR